MRASSCINAATSLLLVTPSAARIHRRRHPNRLPSRLPRDYSRRSNIPTQEGTFQQLIDHNNPDLGTFTQHYLYNAEYYAGPGSPIVLNTPGEDVVDGFYTTNNTLPGLFAQTNNAAVIVLEHRYWGKSSPYDGLSTTNLQYLTLKNAIQDLIYFARNAKLPFDVDGASRPTKAPWILTGCSYSGALAAWTHHLAPGTFWAYHCTSAVIEIISDFWQYYEPIKSAMPTNCSTDMQRATEQIDKILSSGTKSQKHALKRTFGLEALAHDNDFVESILGGLQEWQGMTFARSDKPNPLYQFCDYLENMCPDKDNPTNDCRTTAPGPEGVGTSRALDGFAKWSREVYLPGVCAEYGYWSDNNTVACLDMNDKNSPLYKDLSVNNTLNRQWYWFLCNEPLEFWQVSGPQGTTGIVSKYLDVEYGRMQCRNLFPRQGIHAYGLSTGRNVGQTQKRMGGGWHHVDVNTTRLMWVNGEYDPWRPATVSADARPGGPLQSTPEAPVWAIPKAAHCNDMLAQEAVVNPELGQIVDEILATMKTWVDEYYKKGQDPRSRWN
ncbi:Peptidase S28, partial [Metarhizium majus ARSEF 297]